MAYLHIFHKIRAGSRLERHSSAASAGSPSAGVLLIQMSFIKVLHCAKSCLWLVSCPRFKETEVFLRVIVGNYLCWPSAPPFLSLAAWMFKQSKDKRGLFDLHTVGSEPSFPKALLFLVVIRCSEQSDLQSRKEVLWNGEQIQVLLKMWMQTNTISNILHNTVCDLCPVGLMSCAFSSGAHVFLFQRVPCALYLAKRWF